VLVGTSFGGSLGMLAAADERLDGRVALVASFGAYADLLGVLQAATTGHSLVGDRLIAWEDPHPDAEQIVRDQLADLLEPADRRQLRRLLDDRLEVADADRPARPRTRC
jgi:pimeloyl-ACP methyl ester carboxylesterase